jgi:cupin fold WbuC family metalloprotein
MVLDEYDSQDLPLPARRGNESTALAPSPPSPPSWVAMSRVQRLDSGLFASLIERARQSPRLRTNHNFHTSMKDNPHRLLNVMVRGTYIAPHRHRGPPQNRVVHRAGGRTGLLHVRRRRADHQHPNPGARCGRRRYPARHLAHHRRAVRACGLIRGQAGSVLGSD